MEIRIDLSDLLEKLSKRPEEECRLAGLMLDQLMDSNELLAEFIRVNGQWDDFLAFVNVQDTKREGRA